MKFSWMCRSGEVPRGRAAKLGPHPSPTSASADRHPTPRADRHPCGGQHGAAVASYEVLRCVERHAEAGGGRCDGLTGGHTLANFFYHSVGPPAPRRVLADRSPGGAYGNRFCHVLSSCGRSLAAIARRKPQPSNGRAGLPAHQGAAGSEAVSSYKNPHVHERGRCRRSASQAADCPRARTKKPQRAASRRVGQSNPNPTAPPHRTPQSRTVRRSHGLAHSARRHPSAWGMRCLKNRSGAQVPISAKNTNPL